MIMANQLPSMGGKRLCDWHYSFNRLSTTAGACDTASHGDGNVFVSKFNSGLTGLLVSTIQGGSRSDCGNSIAIDAGETSMWSAKLSHQTFPRRTVLMKRLTIDARISLYQGLTPIFLSIKQASNNNGSMEPLLTLSKRNKMSDCGYAALWLS